MSEILRDFQAIDNGRCHLIAKTTRWTNSVLVSGAESA